MTRFDSNPQKRVDQFLAQYDVISMNDLHAHPFADPFQEDPIWNMATNEQGQLPFSKEFLHMLLYVRNINKMAFDTVEGKLACTQKPWSAVEHNPQRNLFGGGVMTVIREHI